MGKLSFVPVVCISLGKRRLGCRKCQILAETNVVDSHKLTADSEKVAVEIHSYKN